MSEQQVTVRQLQRVTGSIPAQNTWLSDTQIVNLGLVVMCVCVIFVSNTGQNLSVEIPSL